MELRNWRVGLVASAILACGLAVGVAAQPPGSAGASEKADTSVSADASVQADATTESGMQTDQYGVVDAKEWAEIYPLEYNSYLMNAKNVPYDYQEFLDEGGVDTWSVGLENVTDFTSDKVDYLEVYPEIKTLGKGYGYAKYYTEPPGHTYALWTVANNGRLGPLEESSGSIACYTCKTPQIHYAAAAATDADGNTDYWTQPIKEHYNDFDENISCANCHENEDPTQLRVLRADWIRAMGDDADTVPLQGQVCGQCHCDYSMAPKNADDDLNDGEPTSPYYGGLDSMTPENALAFYDEYNFADWTYESTGAKMLAVRHAEFEFNYANGQNPMVKMGYNCNDCHMPTKTDEASGTEYTSHYWVSPLDDEELLAQCNTCHNDLTTEIHDLQADIDGRTHILGLRAEQFVKNFESVVGKETDDGNGGTKLVFDMDTATANGLSEDQVTRLQQIQRYACYYWNLASAENSEGAHNPDFYNQLIDKGNELLDEADGILGMDSNVGASDASDSTANE